MHLNNKQKYKPNQQQTRLPPHSALPISGKTKKERNKVKSLSCARLFVTPWIVVCTKLLRPWDFQGKSTGVGCHFLLQGIFPTQGSNPGLSLCRQMLYRLSHPGGSDAKASAHNARDLGSLPGWGRSPGEGNGNPLQYSCRHPAPTRPPESGSKNQTKTAQISPYTKFTQTTGSSLGGQKPKGSNYLPIKINKFKLKKEIIQP